MRVILRSSYDLTHPCGILVGLGLWLRPDDLSVILSWSRSMSRASVLSLRSISRFCLASSSTPSWSHAASALSFSLHKEWST